MPDAFVLTAARTPIGKFLGSLSDLSAVELGTVAVEAVLERANVAPDVVDEVIMGNVIQSGLGQNPARQVAIKAGLPTTIPAFTVNKVCGSGLKAVMLAAQAIRAGDAALIVAGGMESMSRAPHLLPSSRSGWKYGHVQAVDSLVQDGLWCAFENWSMGEAAEHIASLKGVTRAEMDRFSVQSHQRAAAAWNAGAFADEVVPVIVGTGAKAREVARDEGVRPQSDIEAMARLKPSFHAEGRVTAGNASQLSDGASAVLIGTESMAGQLGVKPLARIVAYATSGVDPRDIFIAPVSAVRKVLDLARMTLRDIDLFELNEAFAAQMLACNQDLQIDETRLNVNGGAIALGHPIGASGARVLTSLVFAMQRLGSKRGLASLCLGGGNAVAMIIERV